MDVTSQFLEAEYRIIGSDPKNATPHQTENVEIIQTWSDGGFFIVKNHIFPIKPGSVFLINAANVHYSNPSDPATYNRSKVIIPGSFFMELARLCGLEEYTEEILLQQGGTAFQFSPESATALSLDRLFKRIKEEAGAGNGDFSGLSLMSALVQILENIIGADRDISFSDGGNTINLLAKFINEKMNRWDGVRMSDIADHLHISTSRAFHLFKELTGKTLTRYTMDLRMSEGKTLLLTTHMKIREISETLKFADPTIFCRYFKKYTGCTPLQYRACRGIPRKNEKGQ